MSRMTPGRAKRPAACPPADPRPGCFTTRLCAALAVERSVSARRSDRDAGVLRKPRQHRLEGD
jgi:hypothetical protein